jgi:hypothetical protein
MNAQIVNRAALATAIAMGLGVSTGSPLGMMVGTGMPLVCLIAMTRRAAFESTFGYYVTALWPMVLGLERYLGSNRFLAAIALWSFAALLLSLPWAMAWTFDRRHLIWRVPLALLLTVVPPLGIIGLASPLSGAGYLFPGSRWLGLAITAILPGLVLSSTALAFRSRCLVICFASGFSIGVAIEGRLFSPSSPEAPAGWAAASTQFGDVSQPFRDFYAAQFIQQKSVEIAARVLIFPEAVVPRWSEATQSFWQATIEQARARGQILAFGAGVPTLARAEASDLDEVRLLRSYDFGAALQALKSVDTAHITYRTGVPRDSIHSGPPRDNAMMVVGAESATFYQRVPVPVGMWQPFSPLSVPLRPLAPAVVDIDHQRTAVLICYEQLITFPVIMSMLQDPTVIVGISNTFWVEHTTIPSYQLNALRGWAKLFGLPYFSAVNS